MKKVSVIHLDKIWGYEKWIYSPLEKYNSEYEDGTKVTGGPLIKIIKANDNLSIQVHPDDSLAQKLENEPNGKAECWFVLEARENQQVQVGLKTYDKTAILAHVNNRTLGEILNYETIKKYDFIDVPAGLVHGICGGTTVLEVQQPSDVTYRLYDYNRKQDGKYRDLHISQSLQAIKDLDWRLKPSSREPLTYKNAAATIVFYTAAQTLSQVGIVVDLRTYQAFVTEQNERIEFDKFVFIPKTW